MTRYVDSFNFYLVLVVILLRIREPPYSNLARQISSLDRLFVISSLQENVWIRLTLLHAPSSTIHH
jgi:hypothetical protein